MSGRLMIAQFHKELRIPQGFTRTLGTVCACTFWWGDGGG